MRACAIRPGAAFGWVVVAAAVVAAAWPAAPAEAAPLRFERCDRFGFSCARLEVPLDRTGAVPGRVSLFVKRRPSARRPRKGVMIVFAGGPGQSATRAFQGRGVASIAAAGRRRDLVIYDQRGTGRSGLLRCPALEKANILHAGPEAAACARHLGRGRAFYTSRDSADDVEALRRRLGVAKVSLYGVSYGTRSALSYALRYPDRVDRMVLDSVVEPNGVDALYRNTFGAVPRVLRALCRRACGAFTRDPVADLQAVVARIAGGSLSGFRVDRRGRRRRDTLESFDLLSALVAGDFEPSLRAAFPAALAAARDGDLAPMLRLQHRADTIEGGPFDPRELSSALYAATSCEEAALPWARGAPFADRDRQARATVDAAPESDFSPFGRETALGSDFLELCARWPEAAEAPVPGPGPLPDVPTLIINGADDLRTPLESARTVADMLPRARLLALPGVGHSALSADPTGCAVHAYARFLNGGRVPRRCRGVRRVTPERPPPRALRDVAPAGGVAGARGRAAAAVALTLHDIAESALFDPFSANGTGVYGGGLRAGSYRLALRGRLRLRGISYVPGVRLTGTVTRFGGGARRGRVRVDGPKGTDGVLRLRGRRFAGRLGGRRVSGRFAPAARGALAPARAAVARPEPLALRR